MHSCCRSTGLPIVVTVNFMKALAQTPLSSTLTIVIGLCADFKFNGRKSTPSNDITCGQKDSQGKSQSFCKLCGGVATLADACAANSE